MLKKYVFGYGSLVSPADAGRTLGRPVTSVRPAILTGWIREWSTLVDNTKKRRYFKLAGSGKIPHYICALNIRKPHVGEVPTNPNGVLIEVTNDELLKLDKRENSYMRVNVTNDIADHPTQAIIYAYVCLPEHLVTHGRLPIIPSPYFSLVAKSFSALSPRAYFDYIRTTRHSSLPIRSSFRVNS